MSIETDGDLSLIMATPEALAREALGGGALAAHLGVAAPGSWPPEYNDADTRAWMLGLIAAHPDDPGYGGWYVVVGDRLIGLCGYKGPPDVMGVIEIGYSLIEPEQRKGYGRRTVALLIERAFRDRRVRTIIADTLPALIASQKVLTANGFVSAGSRPDDEMGEVLRFLLERPGASRESQP